MLISFSIKRAGVYESAKVAEALAATKDFQAVTGKTSLDASHDAVKSAVKVYLLIYILYSKPAGIAKESMDK